MVDVLDGKEYQAINGVLTIPLRPYGVRIFKVIE
jgi:hypothetical protein